ncbi:hypothetical protein H0H87_000570 [Tephrocybe sp. NHM501043]|nr:hypothetical protein H0H87_000570 [Tephrocybe sp. NHM501043]
MVPEEQDFLAIGASDLLKDFAEFPLPVFLCGEVADSSRFRHVLQSLITVTSQECTGHVILIRTYMIQCVELPPYEREHLIDNWVKPSQEG